jgi:AraC-like DNA-binding protein
MSLEETRQVTRPVGAILRPPDDERMVVRRFDPPAGIAGRVAHGWSVEWYLPAGIGRVQGVLPHAALHLVVEDGALRLHGCSTGRFDRTHVGRGRVSAVRLLAGGASGLYPGRASELTDTSVGAGDLRLDPAAARTAIEAAGVEDSVAALFAIVAASAEDEASGEGIRLAQTAVRLAEEDSSITRATTLAGRVGVSTRTLQRLFDAHVGVPPSWVIRRARLHEAVARGGAEVDWAYLAAELGYADQSHLVRDWKEATGLTPTRYFRASDEDGPRPPGG